MKQKESKGKVCKEECYKSGSPYVGIGASLTGILMVIVAIFAIFTPGQMNILIGISWAVVILGTVLGFLQYKSMTQCCDKK